MRRASVSVPLERAWWIPGFLVVLVQCNLPGPSDVEIYDLKSIDGRLLPATVVDATTRSGRLYEFQTISSTITLRSHGRMVLESIGRNVWDGVPLDTVNATVYGSYTRTPPILTIRYEDPDGFEEVVPHEIRNDGAILLARVGLEQRLHEYAKR